jgi:hypothetical protein
VDYNWQWVWLPIHCINFIFQSLLHHCFLFQTIQPPCSQGLSNGTTFFAASLLYSNELFWRKWASKLHEGECNIQYAAADSLYLLYFHCHSFYGSLKSLGTSEYNWVNSEQSFTVIFTRILNVIILCKKHHIEARRRMFYSTSLLRHFITSCVKTVEDRLD